MRLPRRCKILLYPFRLRYLLAMTVRIPPYGSYQTNPKYQDMKKGGAVYIMTNKNHTTLYTGVTSDLWKRINEHLSGAFPNSFSNKYKINKLVYYETFHSIKEAINREKQIKSGSRAKKMLLINSINKDWRDLSGEISSW